MALQKIQAQQRVFDHLYESDSNSYDWQVTILFYAALHLVDDHFERNGHALPNNHAVRNKMVEKHFSDLMNNYDFLFEASMVARYEELEITLEYRDEALSALSNLESKLLNY